jgi:hypothetical protein
LGNAVYSILNGCGHMWYLPMLFWCFIGGWLLEQVKINDEWKMMFLIVLNLLCFVSLPLRLSSAASYMVYFYGGYLVYKHFYKIKASITKKQLIWSWIIFALVFAVLRPLRDVLVADNTQAKFLKLLTYASNNTCQLVYASVGLMAFYCTAVYYTQRHQLKPFTLNLAACCFGIYLFQQFILQGLFYKTDFAATVGTYWLPWLGFAIATPLSYLMAQLLLKTKIGKFLIG